MKIGFYSSAPPENKRNWSGTMYKMYEQMLLQNIDIEWIPAVSLSEKEKRQYKKIENFFYGIFKRGYNRHVNYYVAKTLAKKIDSYLKNKNFDAIFAPTAISAFAFSKTKIPIIYLNDANIAQLLNYYPYYSGFGYFSKLETKRIEKRMLKKAAINIFSSEWAANFAVNHYKVPKDKVKVIKFGANLEVPKEWTFSKNTSDYIFLFLAVDWQRKGGQTAYESLKILRQKGFPVKMQIIGCNPDIRENWVSIIPFLNKNNPQELAEIQKHLSQSDFLFVPTKSDCTPIAFCEAAGFGLPVISTNTGGVSSIIENEKNGILLPENTDSQDYANAIEKLLEKPENIKSMSLNARKKYETELNWEHWGTEFKINVRPIFYR
ncbi:MAG: glycosyltransferase family 4 protein [Flavobacteriaceae bacterium]|jgi:glycosyltransferase involved in cell wall biosynthesis|nr:glycosyltransferase family 4 protein [Flavobacteriaceae bacterium]